jgi:acylglycerol lipase
MKAHFQLKEAELKTLKFEKVRQVDEKNDLYTYNIDYYGGGLDCIEELYVGETMVGTLKIERKYVPTHGVDMFCMHTRVRDTSLFEDDYKATIAIVHGFAENSDIHLESAMTYALNGLDVHLIDLRGYGFSGGSRCGGNKVSDYHYDVATLLKQVNPKLPLFVLGHSMGGLTVSSFFINNPNLNISGLILSAPLLSFTEQLGMDEKKKFLVRKL